MKKALIFGAGNIGRGFLADLLSRSNFSITFVDVDPTRIGLINERREYSIIEVSAAGKFEKVVGNVSGLLIQDVDNLNAAILDADVVLTAVGKAALEHVAPCLARGLLYRLKSRPNSVIHFLVVACENVHGNTEYLHQLVMQHIPANKISAVRDMVDFPNCVVDRIVPNFAGQPDDPLAVQVEEYFQLAIDGTQLHFEPPEIVGMEVSSDLNAVLEQKLFTLNMAHALVAYFGYLVGGQFIDECLRDRNLFELVNGSLREAGQGITSRHKTISAEKQQSYAEKVLVRFQNPFLRDEVTRVARDPRRKLSGSDRLVSPAAAAFDCGVVPACIASGIAAGYHYNFGSDAQASSLSAQIRQYGIEQVVNEVSSLPMGSPLGRLISSGYRFRAL